MKALDFNRFMIVARWDLTVNSKFYTRSALLMVALICMPVVLYYLYNMLTDNSFFAKEMADDVFFFTLFTDAADEFQRAFPVAVHTDGICL